MSEMSDQERELLAAQQNMEQIGEMLRTMFAPMLASHFKALVGAGVPSEAACAIVCSLQEFLFSRFWPRS